MGICAAIYISIYKLLSYYRMMKLPPLHNAESEENSG
jgi:hypothetical protein